LPFLKAVAELFVQLLEKLPVKNVIKLKIRGFKYDFVFQKVFLFVLFVLSALKQFPSCFCR
jgi:hypothetical protein